MTKTEVLVSSRYVDADSQSYSHKKMLQYYAANLHKGSLQGRSRINSMHTPSTTPLIAFLVFTYLTAKDCYKLFKFLNDTLLHMQPEVLTLEHLKCLRKVF